MGAVKRNQETQRDFVTPPANVEAERQLLGAMMLSSDVLGEALESVETSYFYVEAHRHIFEAMKHLFINGAAVDAVTVTEELNRRGLLSRSGGAAYVSELCSDVTSPTSALYYVDILQKNALLRELIRAGQEIIKLGYEQPHDDVRTILDEAESYLYQVTGSRLRDRFSSLEELIQESYEYLDRLQQKGFSTTGIPTGFKDLDELLLGLHPSDLIVVAARPSMGKTSFVLSMARNAAIDFNVPVAIFSLEMSKIQLAQRIISTEAMINSRAFRTGRLAPDEKQRLIAAMEQLSRAPIFIDDTPSIGVVELRTKARRLRARENVGLIIVDYLQLMQGSSRSESRQQEISEISRALKILGRELEVPIIAVSQLSRAVEMRQDKRPQLSDLRESGAIEQDADVVLFIYRDDYYAKEPPEEDSIAEIIVAKHRNGPTGKIRLGFSKNYARFFDLDISVYD